MQTDINDVANTWARLIKAAADDDLSRIAAIVTACALLHSRLKERLGSADGENFEVSIKRACAEKILVDFTSVDAARRWRNSVLHNAILIDQTTAIEVLRDLAHTEIRLCLGPKAVETDSPEVLLHPASLLVAQREADEIVINAVRESISPSQVLGSGRRRPLHRDELRTLSQVAASFGDPEYRTVAVLLSAIWADMLLKAVFQLSAITTNLPADGVPKERKKQLIFLYERNLISHDPRQQPLAGALDLRNKLAHRVSDETVQEPNSANGPIPPPTVEAAKSAVTEWWRLGGELERLYLNGAPEDAPDLSVRAPARQWTCAPAA